MDKPFDYPYPFIGSVLITQDKIEQRVADLAAQITYEYRDSEKLLLLGLLRGSVVFLTDLMRQIHRPLTIDFMSVSSYAGSETTGFVRIDLDHKTNIQGWDVILIDDIVDTGLTVQFVSQLLLERRPKSLKICALLDKVSRHRVDLVINYCGFEIPDYFVVGYGLDLDEKGRNLPYIASVNLETYR